MISSEYIKKVTSELFKWNYFDDSEYTDDISDLCADKATEVIEKYGWDIVYKAWYDYLTSECNTPERVCAFAHLFVNYNGSEYPIPNPYEFLGYFYYHLNLNPFEYDDYNAVQIMDGLSVEVLSKSGARKELYVGDFIPETDSKIIEAVEKWRKKYESE